MVNATLRVRWLFEKSKFTTHRQSLELLKSTLNLLVTSMAFAAAVESNSPTPVSESLQAQIESLKAAVEANNAIPMLLMNSTASPAMLEGVPMSNRGRG
ncbi:hypothetical protein EG329_003476 [Mollisiaceae sp. DMI_Dod_QoI]|nr:hypothetical protein EG329_003476 [Helotiales sp. DMI_Dod_QoI]